MKLAIVLIGMIVSVFASVSVFAAPPKSRLAASTTTTTTSTPTTVDASTTANSSTMVTTSYYASRAEPKMHFSTNILSLLNGKSNANANFFVNPQSALSVSFASDSEKTSPVKKTTPPSTQQLTVSTAQFGVGAAYYFYPMQQKWNISANPYLLSEKRSDSLDTENNLGFGVKADGIFLSNSLTLGAGLQTTSVAGNTTTIVNAAVGCIF